MANLVRTTVHYGSAYVDFRLMSVENETAVRLAAPPSDFLSLLVRVTLPDSARTRMGDGKEPDVCSPSALGPR